MLSAFDSNEPDRYDWLFRGWLKVVPPNTWIYFDISYAGNLIAPSAVVSVIIIFIAQLLILLKWKSENNVTEIGWVRNLQKIGTSSLQIPLDSESFKEGLLSSFPAVFILGL